MRPLGEEPNCPACGAPRSFDQAAPFLPLRTLLAQGRFGIGSVVEQNGDGITYMGFDEQSRQPVHVREFFPAAIALREDGKKTQTIMQGCEAVWQDCAQNFMEIWRKLQRLRGLSALLCVIDVFEENGTIYAVYEYTEAVTLREFLLRGKLGYISWERARTLLMPVLSTLGSLHQAGIIHRGISPNTLFFGADGKVRIGGFSIWQARTAHGDLTAELTDGYAALEQYGLDGQQGAWTDIYAFAAVLYRSLVGSDPDDAVTRRHNDRVMVPAQVADRTPAYVLNALINAMQVFPEDRTRSVDQFRAELSASPTAVHRASPQRRVTHTTTTIPRVHIKPSANHTKKKAAKATAPSWKLALKTAGIILGTGLLVVLIFLAVFQRDRIAGMFDSGPTTTTTAPVEQIEVPDFVGQEFDDDLEQEFEGQFRFHVVRDYDNEHNEGIIARQDIVAGTQVTPDTRITLTVSLGSNLIELPRVIGRDIDEVREELEELGFEVNVTIRANDGGQEPGAVRSVAPREGDSYPRGTRVFVQVWGERTDGADADDE